MAASNESDSSPLTSTHCVEASPAEALRTSARPPSDQAAVNLLDLLASESPTTGAQPEPPTARSRAAELPCGLHSAALVSVENRLASVRLRHAPEPSPMPVADFVDPALLAQALKTSQRVLVESDGQGKLEIVGVLQTQLPSTLILEARTIELNASESVTIRSGRAGLKLRSDGNVELVGSRISAASRGLMRIVGRALRLN